MNDPAADLNYAAAGWNCPKTFAELEQELATAQTEIKRLQRALDHGVWRRPVDGLPPVHETVIALWRGATDYDLVQLCPDGHWYVGMNIKMYGHPDVWCSVPSRSTRSNNDPH
jgi:hypothetical protein